MHTYTHVTVGAAIGAVCFAGNFYAQEHCILGAVVVDAVFLPALIDDHLAGKKPLVRMPWKVRLVSEVFHSAHLWAFILLCAIVVHASPVLTAFLAGWTSHNVIDAPVHGHPKLGKRDPHFLWPLKLSGTGLPDYRRDENLFAWPPKFPELVLFLASSAVTVIGWIGLVS